MGDFEEISDDFTEKKMNDFRRSRTLKNVQLDSYCICGLKGMPDVEFRIGRFDRKFPILILNLR